MLLVLAARPHQGPTRLAARSNARSETASLARIELDPLTSEEATAMLGRADPDQRTAALFEESGGNPFYLEQLARSPELADRLAARPAVSVDGVQRPAAGRWRR